MNVVRAILLYPHRYFFRRKGYGIHSPFGFDLITKVIGEKTPYYCYETLKNKRLELLHYGRKPHFSRKEYELFFRLANRFKPKRILVVGNDILLPQYLTAFSSDCRCTVLMEGADLPPREMLNRMTGNIQWFQMEISDYKHDVDFSAGYEFIFVEKKMESVIKKLDLYRNYFGLNRGVMILSNIPKGKKFWSLIFRHEEVSIAFDMVDFGIIMFDSRITGLNYKSVFV